jgi:hypothetical protein
LILDIKFGADTSVCPSKNRYCSSISPNVNTL